MKYLGFLLVVVLLSAINPQAAASASPASPQQIMESWLSAYNSGRLQELQTVIAAYKIGHSAQRDMDLRESMGPFRVLEVNSSTPSKAELIVSAESSERSLLITVNVAASDPGDVTLFQMEGVETPVAHRPERISLPVLAASAKKKLDALAAADALSGVLVVARDGETLIQWKSGFADREARVLITSETKFRVASLNKMLTAVAVLQLVQAGKLSLNDAVIRHLPSYPDKK